MITNDKTEEADAIINECIKCINNGCIDNFASYEEGVKDALEWFLYDCDKPIIGREV